MLWNEEPLHVPRRLSSAERFGALLAGKAQEEAERRRFLMLSMYFDDSGTPSEPQTKFFVIAGYAATSKQWAGFEKAWEACLQRAPRIGVLKTSAFFALRGPYSQWSETKRGEKVRQLCGVIDRYTEIGIAIAVDMRMFRTMKAAEGLGKDGDPFPFCYYYLLEGIEPLVMHIKKPGVRVDMIYDMQRGGKANHRAEDLFSPEIEKVRRKGLSRVIASSEEVDIELQAADMLAWRMRRTLAGLPLGQHVFHTVANKTVMHYLLRERDITHVKEIITARRNEN